ncbi:fibroblast growth factor receptor-like [Orbicella faveolata]|uniref:fibroblast growth factor receptor-like n=1 Tax=Orbicella faveolata TaxID=48498 RepID=UPI0009E37107|nr:fibroblast growth factor receptor-like [Orbicella faveolata]
MMTDCWIENPDDRPNFTQIRERLEEMMQKDNPYLDFSVLDESSYYYNVPSFSSLNGKSADDELFDKESDEVLKNGSDSNSLGEGKRGRDSYKNETAPFSICKQGLEMDQDIGPANVNKIAFNNSSPCAEDFQNRKDVKVNIEALEMGLYRPGKRGIVL